MHIYERLSGASAVHDNVGESLYVEYHAQLMAVWYQNQVEWVYNLYLLREKSFILSRNRIRQQYSSWWITQNKEGKNKTPPKTTRY